jgi:protein phosphatase
LAGRSFFSACRKDSELPSFAAATHPGLVRSINEDRYGVDEDLGLWLVADGVGGHADGEIAAGIATAAVVDSVSSGELLMAAIRHAHGAVLQEIARRPAGSRMGTTLVALLLDGYEYTVVWVGDSRAYLWDGRQLTQLTRDHSYVRQLVDSGALSTSEASLHPDRHALTQSIGVSHGMALDPGELQGVLQPGERMLLCSDGLTDELSDEEIARQLARHSSVEAQVQALLGAALEAGGRDNVTIVVVGTP